MGHCKSEVHLIKTYQKQQLFQQNDCNTLIFGGPTLGSDHCSHSLRHRGAEVEKVGEGEGTPVEFVIFAHIMFVPSSHLKDLS